MNGETFGLLAVLSLALVLPVLALRGRGLGMEKSLKMIALWLAIFIVVMIAFTWLRP